MKGQPLWRTRRSALHASVSLDLEGATPSAPLEKLAEGKQKITLTVYKQYDKVLSGFQSN